MNEEHDQPHFHDIHTYTDDISEDFPPLTKCVRQMYYQYLKNSLRERNKEVANCKASEEIKTDEMICYLAKQIELKALNACMVAEIYRKKMLEQINAVKYETRSMSQSVNINILSVQEINKFYSNDNNSIDNVLIKQEINDRSSEATLLLDDLGDLDIKEELVEPLNIKSSEVPLLLDDPGDLDIKEELVEPLNIMSSEVPLLLDDPGDLDIEEELVEPLNIKSSKVTLVYDDPGDLDIKEELIEPLNIKDEIFSQMTELFKYEENTSLEDFIFGNREEQIISREDTAPILNETTTMPINDSQENILTENDNLNLRYTSTTSNEKFWPAEECVQAAMLHEQLVAINEINPAKYKTVMAKFESIFGGENEDSASPVTLEVLRNACKERIGHYVVNCLSVYYKKKQIKNKSLFKLLSRSIVQQIYRYDPYIDGEVIWKSIRITFHEEQFILFDHTQLKSAVNKIFTFITKLLQQKDKFKSIFDGDYEGASPVTIEVLRNACKERIGHYVVKCLMVYYRKHQIKNKYLFKLLCKAIVQIINRHDPNIDKVLIWKSIWKVFHEDKLQLFHHTQIQSAVNKIYYFITKHP